MKKKNKIFFNLKIIDTKLGVYEITESVVLVEPLKSPPREEQNQSKELREALTMEKRRGPLSQTRVAPAPQAPASASGRPLPAAAPPPPQSRAPQPPIARLRFEPVDREKVPSPKQKNKKKVSLFGKFPVLYFLSSKTSHFSATQTCPLLLRVFTKVHKNPESIPSSKSCITKF